MSIKQHNTKDALSERNRRKSSRGTQLSTQNSQYASVSEWLEQIGYGDLHTKFEAAGYKDVNVIHQVGLEDKDFDVIGVSEPMKRKHILG